jgi:hypothetical protein
MAPVSPAFLRDEFRLTTWLLMGASVQALLVILYPSRWVVLPALSVVALRITSNLLRRCGIMHDPSYDTVHLGRTTAQLLNKDGSVPINRSDKEIVVFMLGSRANQ